MFSQNLLRCNCGKLWTHDLHTACALYKFALRTHNCARHDTHLATVYFSTKKGNAILQKRMGPKMHGKWNQIARQMTIIIE